VVYSYLERRGLIESWEASAFGILAPTLDLPRVVGRWPGLGYRLLLPLYDLKGELQNIQARSINGGKPKVIFPKGSKAKGTLFASHEGRQVLQGQWEGEKKVILAEGLTDHLALTLTSSVPVVSVPGVSLAPSCIGEWVSGFQVILAFDLDVAGRNSLRPTSRQSFLQGCGSVFRIRWPDGQKDACDALITLGTAGLSQFIEEQLRVTDGKRAD
jgi:DNA primase